MLLPKSLILLAAIACARDLLQLSDEAVPASMSAPTTVTIESSPCSTDWGDFTVSGWFHASSALSLLSIISPSASLIISQTAKGQLHASITQSEPDPLVSLDVDGQEDEWNYVALAVSVAGKGATLCVIPWNEAMECQDAEIDSEDLEGLDLSTATITFGGGIDEEEEDATLEVLDVNIVEVALSPSEIEGMSGSDDCPSDCDEPCGSASECTPSKPVKKNKIKAVCQENGLVSQDKYKDEDLSRGYRWDFGLVTFGYDTYVYSPVISSKKVVFELSATSGDPDLEVYECHFFLPDEFLAKSKEKGGDKLTFDWTSPGFEDGISWLTRFRVYITGKKWFNWYTITFYYYYKSFWRSSNGKALYAVGRDSKGVAGKGWGWALALLIAVVGVGGVAAWAKYREKDQERLPLLGRLFGKVKK